jgi:hypothetical protein
MSQLVSKNRRLPLIHHPSNVLDDLCRYDASHRAWREFDQSLSHQLIELEYRNRQYLRPVRATNARQRAQWQPSPSVPDDSNDRRPQNE